MRLVERPFRQFVRNFQVKLTAACPRTEASADRTGTICQAGGVLLMQALRLTGLDRGVAQWRAPRRCTTRKDRRGPGIAVALAGNCLADIESDTGAARVGRAGGLRPSSLPADRGPLLPARRGR
jgi:hypothetical protein